jgi:hypothetical protein
MLPANTDTTTRRRRQRKRPSLTVTDAHKFQLVSQSSDDSAADEDDNQTHSNQVQGDYEDETNGL